VQKGNLIHYLNVFIFGVIALFGRSYEHSLSGDSLHYAAISKGLLTSSNPLLLDLGGDIYLNKPPLLFWLNSIAIYIFGSNVYGAKFVSILAAILLMLLIFRLAERAFDSTNAGYGAVFFFLANYVVFKNSQACRLESLLTLFTILATVFAYKYIDEHKRRHLMLTGLFCGLAVMTKGLAGIVFLCIILIFVMFKTAKQLKVRLVIDIALSLAVFLMTFGWWYGYAFAKTDLFQVMFINESFDRVKNDTFKDIFKYSKVMLTYNLLIVIFALIGIKRVIWERRSESYIQLFAFFFVIYFIMIHFVGTKYTRYLYQITPIMSLAAGAGVAAVCRHDLKRPFFYLTVIFAFILTLYPGYTGHKRYDQLAFYKPFFEKNSMTVCVDPQFHNKWESRAGLIYYYGDDYQIGDCQEADVYIFPKNGECKGAVLERNKKLKICLQ